MSIREKIILVLMVLALCYGAYELIFSSLSNKDDYNTQDIEGLTEFIQNVSLGLNNKSDNFEVNMYIIDKASEIIEKDPFIEQDLFVASSASQKEEVEKDKNNDKKEKEIVLIYSGYIKIGEKFLAIINGNEYQEGDQLIDKSNFFVESISENNVIVKSIDNQLQILALEDKVL